MGDTIEIVQGTATVVEVAGPTGPQGPAGASQGDVLTTQGDLLYRGASAAARLPIGAAGQVLKVNSGGTAPEWGAAPASGVSSVNGQTGAVTITAASIDAAEDNHAHNFSDINVNGVLISGAGNANANGPYLYSGDVGDRGGYHKDKDSLIYWDGGAWLINVYGEDRYSSTQNVSFPYQVTSWTVLPGAGTAPAPTSSARLSGQEFEEIVGQRVNPTLRGNAAEKNVGTGANDVAAGNHAHGNITNAGLVGTTSGLPLKTGTGGIVEAGSFGTSAGSFCEGNDSRIANIPNGTGSIALGQSGTRTTLNGAASGSDKTISLPNATGTLALTQQATDYEVTDETKGVIMKSANGTRWRVTIDNNGSLLRTALATLILSALMLCGGAQAQVRDLVYGTNNVVVGPTNEVALSFTNSVTFSNAITFGTNAATTRTNLGLGATAPVQFGALALSNTNAIEIQTNPVISVTNYFGTKVFEVTYDGSVALSTNVSFGLPSVSSAAYFVRPYSFDGDEYFGRIWFQGTNGNSTILTAQNAGGEGNSVTLPATSGELALNTLENVGTNTSLARTNLGLGATWLTNTNVTNFRTDIGLGSLATNDSVPSGAAATNSILTADGAGGSSFVVSRTVTRFTTNDQTKTNWANNAASQTTNNDPQMGSWALDANSFYRVEYAVAWVATTNSGFNHALGFTTNLSEFSHRTGVGQAANTTVTAISFSTNVTVFSLPSGSAASTGSRFAVAGFVYVLTSSNANTMNYRWYPINNSADASTLVRSSMVSVTKMSP